MSSFVTHPTAHIVQFIMPPCYGAVIGITISGISDDNGFACGTRR